jgi:hypothetical protein
MIQNDTLYNMNTYIKIMYPPLIIGQATVRVPAYIPHSSHISVWAVSLEFHS